MKKKYNLNKIIVIVFGIFLALNIFKSSIVEAEDKTGLGDLHNQVNKVAGSVSNELKNTASTSGGSGGSFGSSDTSNTSDTSDTSADGMWSAASTWFKAIKTSDNSTQAQDIVSEFITAINIIGTTVIVIATIILGIKYIIGSVDSKADVKESMVTLLIACIFFFAWDKISTLLFSGGRLVFTSTDDASYKSIIGRIFNFAVFVANIAAVAGVIYVGIRYIFSGASGKAELKMKSPYFIIGIILAFCAVSFLTFLSSSIRGFF